MVHMIQRQGAHIGMLPQDIARFQESVPTKTQNLELLVMKMVNALSVADQKEQEVHRAICKRSDMVTEVGVQQIQAFFARKKAEMTLLADPAESVMLQDNTPSTLRVDRRVRSRGPAAMVSNLSPEQLAFQPNSSIQGPCSKKAKTSPEPGASQGRTAVWKSSSSRTVGVIDERVMGIVIALLDKYPNFLEMCESILHTDGASLHVPVAATTQRSDTMGIESVDWSLPLHQQPRTHSAAGTDYLSQTPPSYDSKDELMAAGGGFIHSDGFTQLSDGLEVPSLLYDTNVHNTFRRSSFDSLFPSDMSM
jgi:hypothetical protein